MRRTRAVAGSAVFFLVGPGLEAGVGPYLVARAAGGGADWPLAVRAAGAVLMLAGVAVLIDVFLRFVAEGQGTPSPAAPAARMIAGGAYRHVRHPMYVATTVVIAGEALAFAQPVLLVAAGVYALATAALARVVEEPRLARRFGAAYEDYRRAVPGWWPRLRPWRGGQPSAGGN